MRSSVGGNHHAGGIEIVDAFYTRCAIWEAISAAVFDVELRGHVVEAVNDDFIVEMSAFDDVFVCDVVIADDEAAASDAEGGAGSCHEGLFAAGYVFAEEFDGFGHSPADFEFGFGHVVCVDYGAGDFVIAFDEHEVVIMDCGCYGGHSYLAGFF